MESPLNDLPLRSHYSALNYSAGLLRPGVLRTVGCGSAALRSFVASQLRFSSLRRRFAAAPLSKNPKRR